ncbi:oxidoreductase [Nocardioides luteus]|uniref:NADH:flavin oxidoreductase n=1 Tax=Nocardioides luteus TaxID=1844 RepID=A0A1J4NAM1_9ACTN|nr:FAD-dependent oxidoreductase [Nocardioides luteus]OIJ27537.1 NADH:flavin oxidoreductase [Nocardioides luteus]
MTEQTPVAAPYDILFEPVRIGPFTTKNRFYQVPHCNGMGYRDPSAQAAMRKIKAEGGWSVVCTEQVEIHATSDIAPFIELRIWDDQDLPALKRIADAIHEGGGLAGIELAHNGMNAPNQLSRETPLGPAHLPVAPDTIAPVQARAMSLQDIADLRRWHRNAVRRSLEAGYDVVYVYGAHGYGAPHHFLSRRYNNRTDAYGGSLENRMRLLRELLEDTIEEVAGRAAVACRITVEEEIDGGITREDIEGVLRELGELPDLWDFAMGSWEGDSVTSRFAPEGRQEEFVAGLKKLTTKPVVGVGRFTSPDAMVRQVKAGILDLIGAARPSIADPFLPNKIRDGRLNLIRECIGCNICVSGDLTMSPIRCTQNPSMGEEWRRGWHPERIRAKESDSRVLVVGAGPSGLEAARALGLRGYDVVLAEAGRDLGGRVTAESKLPGLSAWGRVKEYREAVLADLPNVEIYRESPMAAADIVEFGFEHVITATGATWRTDGVARFHTTAMPIDAGMQVLGPDDLFAGRLPDGKKVVVYDDDHYYLGGVVAELLAQQGYDVSIVTTGAQISSWTNNTFEINRIQRRLIENGITRVTDHAVVSVGTGGVRVQDVYAGAERDLDCDAVVMVTARLPREELYLDLLARRDAGEIASVRGIGDSWAPGTIAAAVWSGRRAAEEFDAVLPSNDEVPFRREVTQLA